MAYDEVLADRIRSLLHDEPDLTEQRMFGGLAFLLGGRMAVAVSGSGGLLLRCDPVRTEELVQEPHVDRFEMRARQLDGWLHVEPAAVASEAELGRWLKEGVGYARTLPPRSPR